MERNQEESKDVQESDLPNKKEATSEEPASQGSPPRDPESRSPKAPDTAPTTDSAGGKYKLGQRVWGPILRMTETQAIVALSEQDLDEGTLDLVHLRDEFGNLSVSEGDEVQAFVVELEPELKLAPSLLPPPSEVLRRLREVHSRGETVRGRVLGVNRGGLEVDIDGRRAFCPYSQIEIGRCSQPEVYINHILDFKVSELDEEKRRIILSRRVILEKEREAKHAELRAQIKEGTEFDGVVSRLQPFGAFVDIGGIEGLVHVSEISHDRINHPREVLRSGEKVRVRVLGISRDSSGKERFKLSIKATLEDPWSKVHSLFHTGDIVTGKVVRVTDFGAFVKLYPGIEGLLHVSQYRPRRREGEEEPTAPTAESATPADAAAPVEEPASAEDATETAAAAAEEVVASTTETPTTAQDPAAAGDEAQAPAEVAATSAPSAPETPVETSAAEEEYTPQVGDEITVRIARIEMQRRRVALNLRESSRPGGKEHDASVGEILEGVVRAIKPFGIFVDLPSLGPWASGLLPGAETGLPRGTNLKRRYKTGDKVRVEIIEVDERGRIRVSQRSIKEREERGESGGPDRRGRGLTTAPPGGFNVLAEAFRKAQQEQEGKKEKGA